MTYAEKISKKEEIKDENEYPVLLDNDQWPPKKKERMKSSHYSDCAVHNAPAYPDGECDCGAVI